ncbi:MAG: hypothetical protein O3B31_09095 [Chloroflexi bacterium]|nr:hypothetical protein [Chloroflexota bacterium]MDA1003483.1 hypothetical protein [Chloroflexota bacterium]
MTTFSLVIHVIAAAVLVGPQLVLFLAVIPSTWLIPEERLRRDVTRVVTARFGMLAGLSLVLLVVTGLYQFYAGVPDEVRENLTDYRFGTIFSLKMVMFVIFIALLVLHTVVIGGRIRRLSDHVIANPDDDESTFALDNRRRTSFMLSALMLIVAFAVLALGVMLGDDSYAYELR